MQFHFSHKIQLTFFILLIVLLTEVPHTYGEELKTRYATLTYSNEKQLNHLNYKLYFGKFSHLVEKENSGIADEIKNKIDMVVEKNESFLEMFPENLDFKIKLFSNASEVRQAYFELYEKKVDFIAFYSPENDTIYLSEKNINIKILSHEIAHAIFENYFEISPPQKIHELIAQFAEKHILD